MDSPGGVRLRNAFILRQDGAGSIVGDDVDLECPRLVLSFVVGEARKAHTRLLLNLKRRMEERT